VSRWGELIRHDEENPSCLCGCRDEIPGRPEWFERDIVAPVSEGEHEAIRIAQRALRIPVTGGMNEATRASLRGVQALYGVPVTGFLDEATAVVIDKLRPWQVEADGPPVRKY